METWTKLQLNTDMKSDSRSLPKEEMMKILIWLRSIDWIQTSVKLFENIYWNQQQAATIVWDIMKMMAMFATENLHASLKISWKIHSLIKSHSLPNPNSKKETSLLFSVHLLLLLAARYSHFVQTTWSQLQSLEAPRSNSKPSWSSL
jgi:hypothetical protein